MMYNEDYCDVGTNGRPTRQILIVVDMQYDFIDGSLANKDAEAIVKPICDLIRNGNWDEIVLTRDTHNYDYLNTPEGIKLPVTHCVEGTKGWLVHEDILKAIANSGNTPRYIDKKTFGYRRWDNWSFDYDDITIVGTCTDICVVSNALILKANFPEAKIKVIGNLCAGVTEELHNAALDVMRSCQIDVVYNVVYKDKKEAE